MIAVFFVLAHNIIKSNLAIWYHNFDQYKLYKCTHIYYSQQQ